MFRGIPDASFVRPKRKPWNTSSIIVFSPLDYGILFAVIFQQSDRDMGSLFNTLTKWRKNFSDNEVLGSAWALTPCFIIYNFWKERNNRIFKNVKNSSKNIFDRILKQIKETVSITVRNLPSNLP